MPQLSFGPLEKEVLEVLWERPAGCCVRDIFQTLQQRRDIAYTTVMTVMNRLVEKGALRCCREGKAHTYAAIFSRDDIVRMNIQSFLSQLAHSGDESYRIFSEEVHALPAASQLRLLKALTQVKS